MKKVLLILLVSLFLVISNIGCKPTPQQGVVQQKPVIVVQPQINLGLAITNGNNTYIPLNLPGTPPENIHSIQAVEEEFERSHPEFEVISYQVYAQDPGEGFSAFIHGISAHHKPKEK